MTQHQSGNLNNAHKQRVRIEWNNALQQQLADIQATQADLLAHYNMLEIRLIEKMENNQAALRSDLSTLRTDVVALSASYHADKEAYERRFKQLEDRPSCSWESEKSSIEHRLKTLEGRAELWWSRAAILISALALLLSFLYDKHLL